MGRSVVGGVEFVVVVKSLSFSVFEGIEKFL